MFTSITTNRYRIDTALFATGPHKTGVASPQGYSPFQRHLQDAVSDDILYLLKEKPMLLTNLRKPFCTTFLVSGLVLGVSSTPINAIPLYPGSDTSPQLLSQVNGFTLKKAQNAARQAIEELNGGLQVYQAEFAMHGPAQGAPFTDDGNYWTFTFVGGPPGWTTPSIRSIVEVSKDGEQVNVVYNGSVSGSVDRDTDRRSDDDSEDLTSTDFDAENLRWNNLSTQLIQEDNWTGLLGLSRLSNTTQDALVTPVFKKDYLN
jgi:hypothetical protein